nr:mitochondrial inner membrane protease subunit 2 isoform X1 [Camelus dromedarius]XP_031311070.1 mitochondrial inner membrane protease subunit 2 isoform X1 [Camelus dromedarius]XP_031311071.1 mitochondrial inner membrane protease subunit 2 isoform X1 [Camelus dromedarius]XP_031311072.1 mitochondrial inner membrane protease subunit 2 isoform X1 [Camelus dromedarius]
MAHSQGWVKRYLKAFCKGFFVAVPVAVTFLDRVACVARVEGASMQPSLNPGGSQSSDVVLLNHWKVRNFEVQRGDIVSLVSPKNPEQKIIKRVIALEGDIVKTIGHKNRYVKVPRGHIWVEGDHHGHSFDSNSFGPSEKAISQQERNASIVESHPMYPKFLLFDEPSKFNYQLTKLCYFSWCFGFQC